MLIVATTPLWNEAPETVERCRRSLPSSIRWLSYQAGLRSLVLGGRFESESEMRDYGRVMAANAGGDWWLQLDADERLVAGERLPALLETAGDLAYPLPYLQESDVLLLAPYKLIRLRPPFTVVYGRDHVMWGSDRGRVWSLAPHVAGDRLRDICLAGPHLVHEPTLRPAERRVARLSTHAGVLETLPASVPWPIGTPYAEARAQ